MRRELSLEIGFVEVTLLLFLNYPILYFSMCVCVSGFFLATAEPFALKFCMVFRNSAGKILSKFFGPMVALLDSKS